MFPVLGTPLRGVWALRESEDTPSFLVDADSSHEAGAETGTKEEGKGENEEEGAETVGECRPFNETHIISEEKENTEEKE